MAERHTPGDPPLTQPKPPSQIELGTDPQAFLDRYWQKAPLRIPGALPGFRNPLSPEELAGLACADEVEARLVLERAGARPWEVRHGPFQERDFTTLPETHWTLLVQDVDKRVAPVGALREAFRFLPDWRIDDIMVSYAPEAGGVGPHVDHYDVFLLQGLGRRRWQIQRHPSLEWVPSLDLRILARFEAEEEWVLEPGDLLYLPPGVAHYGVALEPCMTYSIGFRAPTHRELVSGWMEQQVLAVDPESRYCDPPLRSSADPVEIGADALERIRQILTEALRWDEDTLARWFTAFVTEPKPGLGGVPPRRPLKSATVHRRIRNGAALRPEPACRFAVTGARNGYRYLAVDGRSYSYPDAWHSALRPLCAGGVVPAGVFAPFLDDPAFVALLTELYHHGALHVGHEPG